MTFYFAKVLDRPFDEVLAAAREALASEGFGVLTEIDVRKTFKAKLDEDFRPYVILGACNPQLAREALRLEDKVGVMLPCNVVVQHAGDDRTEVAAVDPVASMQAIANPALKAKASEVAEKLRAVVDRI